ncbi:MAG TPA: recombinase family protein, partial [Isosphaeraceae bacterium]|nr:recombinase family protein [Isosphaeraceae bacterium]
VNVLSGAPYGYRYVGKHEGDGEARYQVVAEEARVVRKIFEWVGQERCSIGEVCRRLRREGIPSRTGKPAWDRSVVWATLKNPAYRGTAAFGKTRAGELKPQRLRPQRGRPEQARRPVSRVDTASEEQILIDVPGLVSEDLFGAVQAQLEENRQRRRDRPGRGRYLLQGLVVCKRCGYGCYGKPTSRASAQGQGKVPYAYYRCTGSDAYRFGGQRLCWNKQVRTDMLDAAVWEDVRRLLSEPERVRSEYERRRRGAEAGPSQEAEHIRKLMNNVKKMISRLIDAYGDGLLDKSEFEPRISAARTRLAKLEEEYRQRISGSAQEAELRLVIGQLEEFARRVSQELREPDWDTRREIVRALVKKVEIDEEEVRIVYRVSPSPFEGGPQQGRSQHCWGRDHTALRDSAVGGVEPPVLKVSRFEEVTDETQETVIVDFRPENPQDDRVIDLVEARADISLDEPFRPRTSADDLPKCGVTPSSRSESVRTVAELRLVVGFQDGPDHFLEKFVRPAWHPQRSQFSVLLRDVGPPHRLPPVAFLSHGVDDFINLRERHPVHGLLGCSPRHRAIVGIEPRIGAKIQVALEQQSIDPFQWQSALPSISNDVQSCFGCTHHAYLAICTSSHLFSFVL